MDHQWIRPFGNDLSFKWILRLLVLYLSKEKILHRQEKATLPYPKGSTVLPQQTANEGLARDLIQYKSLTGPQIITSLLLLLCASSGYEPVT